MMLDFLFAQDEVCRSVRENALSLIVLSDVQVIHVERLVEIHLLQKVFPNRNEALLYLI